MTAAQERQLYAAGGFPFSADGKSPTNRCSQPTRPQVYPVDINGDGKLEALFKDKGNCYKPDGSWYAITTQGMDGTWRRLIEGPGDVVPAQGQANGWRIVTAISGGKRQTLSYDIRTQTYGGQVYAATGISGVAPNTPASTPSMAAPATQTPAQRDIAVFRAAGFKQTKRGWESGCDDSTTGAIYDPGKIEQVKDLNGDGRPEAVVVEGGSYCYGNTGSAFWLVSQQANGTWRLMYDQVGIAEFMKTVGVGGFPDILVGGPGFCFPVMRWNGVDYINNRMEYEGKRCTDRSRAP